MIIACDLDGTLCESMDDWKDYYKAPPIQENIEKLRKLKTEGNWIIIYTGRPWHDEIITEKWLYEHNVPYDSLIMGKLRADLYIDNDSKRMEEL